MGTSSLSLSERINGCIKDTPDILYQLTKIGVVKGQPIEIVTELPAACDPDILLGHVQRWVEIQKHFDCDVRVYAWSYTVEVEKHLLGCVQNMSHIAVSVLPMYLKENKKYA